METVSVCFSSMTERVQNKKCIWYKCNHLYVIRFYLIIMFYVFSVFLFKLIVIKFHFFGATSAFSCE